MDADIQAQKREAGLGPAEELRLALAEARSGRRGLRWTREDDEVAEATAAGEQVTLKLSG